VDKTKQHGYRAVSTSLATDSSTSDKHTTLGGRPISAGALDIQAGIFHSFSQLLQEDITLNIALSLLTVLTSQMNVRNFCNGYNTLNIQQTKTRHTNIKE
jgi:hypothetical protein